MANSDDDKSLASRTQIIVALIGVLGVVSTAVFSNWDKIFSSHRQSTVPPSPASSTQPFSPGSNTPAASTPPSSSPSPLFPDLESFLTLQLPRNWRGTANQKNYGSYPMVFHIENISGQAFSGKLQWTTLRNSITSVEGRIVEDFGDLTERSKWEFVKGFGTDEGGAWLTFTETRLLQGNGIFLGVIYYAHLKDDGSIHGVWFGNDSTASEPGGDFELLLSPQ